MNNENQTQCSNCDGIYVFEKSLKYDVTYAVCPYCGYEAIIMDDDKVVSPQIKVLVYQFILLSLLCICIVSVCVVGYNFNKITDFIQGTDVPTTVDIESVFMDGVGYEFTDNREPTDDELFVMEESLNLCYNPTYNELVSFIEEDETNYYEYIDEWFVCSDFAWSIIVNARNEKIRCGGVTIYPEKQELYEYDEYFDAPNPHAIVVFNTTDKGLVFVEPQLDDMFLYSEFIEMQTNNYYYAEDEWFEMEMDFDHYVIDWFYWYYDIEQIQIWNVYKNDYPDFDDDYGKYFEYNV